MTAIEVLRSAEPPAEDGSIDQALTDLDVKIWTWTDAMLSAQTFLKRTLSSKEVLGAVAPTIVRSKPQPVASLAPAEPVVAAPLVAPAAGDAEWRPQVVGEAAAPVAAPPQWAPPPSSWERPAQQQNEQWGAPQPMQWPSNNSNEWAAAPAATQGTTTEWPSTATAWPSSDSSNLFQSMEKPAEEAAAAPKPKVKEKPVKMGPSDEELAARAAHEQEVMAALDETTARRVRLLRRLDPDAKIEQLVEKARQTSAEASDKNDKASWWRRK
ncbi:MAG TPA: hypothetical protein VEL28_15205 [Candidatus Binatia bacterium]|nr:hypothetical protein [Candidatus Binatia bacterium]